MMISMNSVRRRKDGTIDTEYYVAIGNRERGRVMRVFWARAFGRLKPGTGRAADRQAVPPRRVATSH